LPAHPGAGGGGPHHPQPRRPTAAMPPESGRPGGTDELDRQVPAGGGTTLPKPGRGPGNHEGERRMTSCQPPVGTSRRARSHPRGTGRSSVTGTHARGGGTKPSHRYALNWPHTDPNVTAIVKAREGGTDLRSPSATTWTMPLASAVKSSTPVSGRGPADP